MHDPLKQRLLLQIGCVAVGSAGAQAGALFTVQVAFVALPFWPLHIHDTFGPVALSVIVADDESAVFPVLS